jgi:hypothetical protein
VGISFWKFGRQGSLPIMKTLENFNAVQYMREQRDRLSQKLWSMKPDEVVEYFSKKSSTQWQRN